MWRAVGFPRRLECVGAVRRAVPPHGVSIAAAVVSSSRANEHAPCTIIPAVSETVALWRQAVYRWCRCTGWRMTGVITCTYTPPYMQLVLGSRHAVNETNWARSVWSLSLSAFCGRASRRLFLVFDLGPCVCVCMCSFVTDRPALFQGCGLCLDVSVSRRINVSSRTLLEKICQRLGLVSVSAIYVSCPRPIFGQIVQATVRSVNGLETL